MLALVRAFGLMATIIFLSSLVANQADAQILRGTVRGLGVLPGSGYHVNQPLTDSSYYHPYSSANSSLYTTPASTGVFGVADAGYWQNYGVEFGSYPGHTARPLRWNSWSRGW